MAAAYARSRHLPASARTVTIVVTVAPTARAWLAFTVLCAGCSSGGYTVVVRFEPPSIARDAPRVQLALVGSCAAQGGVGAEAIGVIETVELRRGASGVALGDAPPGAYGLYVRAWSATCHVVAAGCADVMLDAGGDGELVVTARGVAGIACPSGTACTDGTCRSLDAGATPPGGGSSDAGACPEGGAAVGCWADVDSDGYARAGASPASFCGSTGGCPPGTTDVAPTGAFADCDDALPEVRPGALDVCNGVDDDCDAMTDEVPSCPSGCEGVAMPASTRRYMFCSGNVPFAAAAMSCVANGMRLVRIDEASEDDWVLATATVSFGMVRYWIGATDETIDGDWRWIDGTRFWTGDLAGMPVDGLYSNWAPGLQPSGGAAEACADGRPDSAGHWGDVACTIAHPFVCEQY